MNIANIFASLNKIELTPHPWMKKENFILVTNLTQLRQIIDEAIKAGRASLDLETTGLDSRIDDSGRTKDTIVGYCLSYNGIQGYYIPIGHKTKGSLVADHPENIKDSKGSIEGGRIAVNLEIKRLCENCVTIFHNSAFDHEFLYGNGSNLNITDPDKFEDTLILDYLRNSTDKRHGLKHLSSRFLKKEMFDLKELFPSDTKNRDFSTLDPSDLNTLYYACADGICTYLLFDFYTKHNWRGEPEKDPKKTIYGEQTQIYRIEKQLIPALRWMERNRVQVDVPYLRRLKDEIEEMIEISVKDLTDALIQEIGDSHWLTKDSDGNYVYQFPYDVTSPKQLGDALLLLQNENPKFRKVNLNYTDKSKQVKTDDASMEELYKKHGHEFPFLRNVQVFRTLQKALGTYVRPLYENSDWEGNNYHPNRKNILDNSIRFQFLPNRVDTGRFAANKGQPDHGYSGINVQSTPATRKYVKVTGHYILQRPKGKSHGDIDPEIYEARQKMGFLRLIRDGHFIQNHRTGQEFCIRTTCDGCPFLNSCKKGPKTQEIFYSVENAIRPALVSTTETEENDHVIVACDFAGLELRATANIANEEVWIQEFNHGDGDLHKITATLIYGEQILNLPPAEYKIKRESAKAVNFAIIYGGGGSAIARATGVSNQEGTVFRDRILKGMPTFSKWMDDTIKTARRTKEVSTSTGRKIRLEEINSPDGWIRAKQERNAINSIVQGSATGDLIKYAMGSFYREIHERGWESHCKMILTMHDELVFDIRTDYLDRVVPVIHKTMTEYAHTIVDWPVQLEIDIEFNTDWSPKYDWGKIHEIDPKTKLAKQETPFYLVNRIKFEPGMYYLNAGEKNVYNGTKFVDEKTYLEGIQQSDPGVLNMETTNMSLDDLIDQVNTEAVTPEHSEKEKPEQDTSEETSLKPKISNMLPVYYHLIPELKTEEEYVSYITRLRKVEAAFKSFFRLKLIRPTHNLEVYTHKGKNLGQGLQNKNESLINLEIFNLFKIYEGI